MSAKKEKSSKLFQSKSVIRDGGHLRDCDSQAIMLPDIAYFAMWRFTWRTEMNAIIERRQTRTDARSSWFMECPAQTNSRLFSFL